jgi:hypothetical protein
MGVGVTAALMNSEVNSSVNNNAVDFAGVNSNGANGGVGPQRAHALSNNNSYHPYRR